MKIRVLVVDDSAFFRKRIIETLQADPSLTVIGTANNGLEALAQAKRLKPDVITMDIEMPEMNGIEAVRKIMAECPTPIMMFSSLTYEGARATLDALDAGALDFLPKQLDALDGDNEAGRRRLQQRVAAIARRLPAAQLARPPRPVSTPPLRPPERPVQAVPTATRMAETPVASYGLVVIGASTGGPVAVQELLSRLPANFPSPVVVAIHMPANFTAAYAERVNNLCRLHVCEARDGDSVRPGQVLLAPGGLQIVFEPRGADYCVRVKESPPGQIYRPSVDLLFGSAARVFGKRCLAIVLTGMGADGAQGARALKRAGARIWSQSEQSCVVYGMPQAVESEGLSDRVMTPLEMAKALQG
jgi:two-component system chemotaxis response regulator CheB